jgi:hypothetical protein
MKKAQEANPRSFFSSIESESSATNFLSWNMAADHWRDEASVPDEQPPERR